MKFNFVKMLSSLMSLMLLIFLILKYNNSFNYIFLLILLVPSSIVFLAYKFSQKRILFIGLFGTIFLYLLCCIYFSIDLKDITVNNQFIYQIKAFNFNNFNSLIFYPSLLAIVIFTIDDFLTNNLIKDYCIILGNFLLGMILLSFLINPYVDKNFVFDYLAQYYGYFSLIYLIYFIYRFYNKIDVKFMKKSFFKTSRN